MTLPFITGSHVDPTEAYGQEARREEAPPPPSETDRASAAPSLDELMQIGDPPTLAQASAAFVDAAMESCADVIALLAQYDFQREIAGVAGKDQTALSGRIKAHIEACDEHDHRDGEHGLDARIQRRETNNFDVPSMPEAMVVALAAMGVLKVDLAAMKALRGKFPAVDDAWSKFRMPGESVALEVKVMRR